MTEKMKKEIIEAFAYGHSDETVSEITGVPLAEVKGLRTSCADAIAEKTAELKEAGYI